MSENNFSRTDFATQFTDFVAAMNEEAKEHKRDAVFLQKLKDHFRTNPITLPVISDYLHGYDHVNLQLALDQLIEDDKLTRLAWWDSRPSTRYTAPNAAGIK